MVYLSKKDADKIIKKLVKIKNKEIIDIIKKLKYTEERKAYAKDDIGIRRLLQKAFDEKRKVKIRYYSPHSDEHTTRIINIYQIYINAIIAYCHLRKDERTFVIDRINSAAMLDERYSIPRGWSPESVILDK